MPCPLGTCACHHMADEVCWKDTPRGLAHRDRLDAARAVKRLAEARAGVGAAAVEPPLKLASDALDWLVDPAPVGREKAAIELPAKRAKGAIEPNRTKQSQFREEEAGARFDAVMADFRAAWAKEHPSEPFEVDGRVTPRAMAFITGCARQKGKGGRPPGPTPWKDRLKAYKREYMRVWRARRKARQG